jgi:hypothetical protein
MSLLSQASLVMTANAIKQSKIYSIIPTNGNGDADFTRGTLASSTLTSASGLIESVPYNLLLVSEDLSNVAWVKGASTINSNVINSPNGTLTADRITADGTSTTHNVSQTIIGNIISGNTYSMSLYVKKDTNNFFQLFASSAIFGANFWGNFDLNNGTLGSKGSSTTSSILDVGNGWYRCTIIGSAIANGISTIFETLTTSATSPRGETNTLNTSVFLWGAQVVQDSTPKDYFFTTDRLNVPRLNYESYGGCPSILLEPQRTNLLLNSVWAGGGSLPTSWTATFATGTSTPIASIKNPNVTAYRFVTSTQRQVFQQTFSFVLSSITTFSVYVESVTTAVNVNQLLLIDGTGTGTPVYLKNNVAITASTPIEAGNTYSLQFSCTLGGSFSCKVGCGTGSNITGNFVLSMPQVEQGLFPRTAYSTSFIPTTTGSVTRNADVFTRNNLYANGIISDIGGTWFLEINNNLSLIRDGTLPSGISLDANPVFFDDGFLIRNNFNGTSVRLGIEIRQGGSIVGTYSTLENTVKIAIKWDGTVAIVYVNGVVRIDFVAFTTKIMNYLSAKADDVPKYIKSMLFFPLPLSNSEMVALTSSTNYISYENMAINLNYVIQ